MIKRLAESSGNVVGYKFVGTITAEDYRTLEPEVKVLMEKQGNICLLFDLSDFKWEKMEAWLPDLRLGAEFRHKLEKMAIVGDKTWEKWVTHLAKPFFARDAKFFHSADIAKAWAWLRE
jgi:hypothetical protein